MEIGSAIPLNREAVGRVVSGGHFDVRCASIREMNGLIDRLEREFGVDFIRMEFGIPGMPTCPRWPSRRRSKR